MTTSIDPAAILARLQSVTDATQHGPRIARLLTVDLPALLAALPHPYYELLVMDDEHPTGHTGFVCSICRVDVNDTPCAVHAPTDVPGLVRMDCQADPKHHLWTLAGDYYDPPCWRCEYEARVPKPQPCKHWAWHRWRLTGRAVSLASRLNLVHYSYIIGGPDHRGCIEIRWPRIRRSRQAATVDA